MNKVIIGANQYCGPAVLSILTGKSVDECSDIFASYSSTTQINTKEITYPQLITVLTKLRYKFTELPADCSLYSCMISISSKSGFYIVGVPKHVVAVEVTEDHKVFLCDNHTKEPISGGASARLMQRVDKLIKVELKPAPKLVSTSIRATGYKNADGNTTIYLKKMLEYEDIEDNVTKQIGNLTISNFRELELIINELTEVIQTI